MHFMTLFDQIFSWPCDPLTSAEKLLWAVHHQLLQREAAADLHRADSEGGAGGVHPGGHRVDSHWLLRQHLHLWPRREGEALVIRLDIDLIWVESIWCDLNWFELIWFELVWFYVRWGDDYVLIWCDMRFDVIWYVMWSDMWCDVMWVDLIWFDLNLFNLIWFDVSSFDLIWHDMICFDLNWFNSFWFDLIWPSYQLIS